LKIALRHILLSGLALGLPLPAAGFDLDLPGTAVLALQESEPAGSYGLPVSPWLGSDTRTEPTRGAITRMVWQLPSFDATTTQLMGYLRAQFEDEGYEPIFACDTTLCGGFDFRFAMDVAPEPVMHVDLGDFAYFAARAEGEDGPDHVGLLVSRGGRQGYVHLVRISAAELPPIEVSASAKLPDATDPEDLIGSLETGGSATLGDLAFDTGAATLEGGDYESLLALAAYLEENPELDVVLVGHTDAEGALDINIALSRSRAQAVRGHLIDVLGVAPGRLRAEGVGYLAPRATNTSSEGREYNRRVEVIITSTR